MDLKQELIDRLCVPENWDKYDYQTQRYSFDDMQEVLEDIVKKLTMPSFSSKEELAKHIQMNMPFAVRPTKKAKTMYVNPFTSSNARRICIDCIVDSLLK